MIEIDEERRVAIVTHQPKSLRIWHVEVRRIQNRQRKKASDTRFKTSPESFLPETDQRHRYFPIPAPLRNLLGRNKLPFDIRYRNRSRDHP